MFGHSRKTNKEVGMAGAKKVKEITVITPDKAGMLYNVTSAVASSGVNIMAITAHGAAGNKAKFMLVTDNNAKAMKALKAKKFKVKENAAIAATLTDKVGEASRLARRLAKAGVDLDYCYGSATGKGKALLVFSTKDLTRALKVC